MHPQHSLYRYTSMSFTTFKSITTSLYHYSTRTRPDSTHSNSFPRVLLIAVLGFLPSLPLKMERIAAEVARFRKSLQNEICKFRKDFG